jgi:replicative DNA helicase
MSTPERRPAAPRLSFAPAMPADLQLERATLGGIALFPAVAARLLPQLHAEHFTDRRHRDLLELFRCLHTERGGIQPAAAEIEWRRQALTGTRPDSCRAVLHAALIEAPTGEQGALIAARRLLDVAARRRVAQAGLRLLAAGINSDSLPELLLCSQQETAYLQRDLASNAHARNHLRAQPELPHARQPRGQAHREDGSELIR